MDRQNGVSIWQKIFNLETEGNSDPCCKCEWTLKTYVREVSQNKEHIPYDSTYLRSLKQSHSLRQKVGWWLPGLREKHGSQHLTDMDDQFYKMKKVLEMDSGGGCTTVWMYLMPLNLHFKMFKMVSFMLCVFYHNLFKPWEIDFHLHSTHEKL